MRSGGIRMEPAPQGSDVFFLLIGAVLVFAMHGGFAFLEAGTVRHKNQVNALVKIMVDFAISTIVYFFVGYRIAYGVSFLQRRGRDLLAAQSRLSRRATAGEILLPLHLRRGSAGDHFGRHRRAREIPAAMCWRQR